MNGLRNIVLFLAAAVCWPVAGDILPNDHGRTLHTATPLNGSSNSLTGTLEHDTDIDVFSFPFKPWTTYTLAVETATVWGVEIRVIPPDGVGSIWETNSVWESDAAVAEAYHEGASARWYVSVAPLFDFTTGTYHLAIWEDPGQDADEDGFPDAWEMDVFGDLDTADPELHGDIFRTGREPDDPLVVDSIQSSLSGDVVGWSLEAYGTYDVFTSTNLLEESNWQFLHTHIAGPSGGVIQWTNTPSGEQIRFYHIRFRDE